MPLVKIITMTSTPKDVRVGEIAGELCDLMEQQIKAITGRGLDDLTHEEAASYEVRRTHIAELRSELHALAFPN